MRTPEPPRNPSDAPATPGAGFQWLRFLSRGAGWIFGLLAAAFVSVLILVGLALAVAYPNLPEISSLTDYRPKLPMRVFSSDAVQLGEFGEERRNFMPIAEIPRVMKDAVLAAEDARFYQHGDRKSVV